MNNKLTDFSEVDEVFFTTSKDLSLISHYGKFYHNPSSVTKCPRCGDCGIFAKIKPKKRLHGLRQSIAQGELTKALEILEVAGHLDQDAIAALNLYRGGVGHE